MHEANQVRLLEAMGYRLLRRAIDSAPVADAVDAVVPASTTGTVAAKAPPSSGTAAPPSTASLPVGNGPGDRLWAAVLGAAALDPPRADALGIRRAVSGVAFEYIRDELWIDPLALGGDASAKRRLWKALRALRLRELAR
jgi:hypothetical protein